MGGTVALQEQWHSARKEGWLEKSITAIFRTAGFPFLPGGTFPRALLGFRQYERKRFLQLRPKFRCQLLLTLSR